MTDPLLTISDVCRLLQIRRNTLSRWRKNPTFPQGYKMGAGRSGRVMFAAADIDAWLAAVRDGMASQEITARDAVTSKASGQGQPVRTVIVPQPAHCGGHHE